MNYWGNFFFLNSVIRSQPVLASYAQAWIPLGVGWVPGRPFLLCCLASVSACQPCLLGVLGTPQFGCLPVLAVLMIPIFQRVPTLSSRARYTALLWSWCLPLLGCVVYITLVWVDAYPFFMCWLYPCQVDRLTLELVSTPSWLCCVHHLSLEWMPTHSLCADYTHARYTALLWSWRLPLLGCVVYITLVWSGCLPFLAVLIVSFFSGLHPSSWARYIALVWSRGLLVFGRVVYINFGVGAYPFLLCWAHCFSL